MLWIENGFRRELVVCVVFAVVKNVDKSFFYYRVDVFRFALLFNTFFLIGLCIISVIFY